MEGRSLVPSGGSVVGRGLVLTRLERHVAREVTVARARGAVVAARELAKVEAISDITQGALMETSQISEVEALLFARSPHAGERLKQIADCGVAAIADVVLRAGRSMR